MFKEKHHPCTYGKDICVIRIVSNYVSASVLLHLLPQLICDV
jgi:hypothetical protein